MYNLACKNDYPMWRKKMNFIEWIKGGFKSEKRDSTIQPINPWPRMRESKSN